MKRVLIANRGEIAVRVIRACREEGLEAVAVYSDADRQSPHVRAADHAVHIGPAPAAESYLNIPRLISAARRVNADAVHPGYGFLSERAAFARAVVEGGMRFVGPPADAIQAMGDKTDARRRMAAAGVAVVPGTSTSVGTPDDALAAAGDLGFPLLVKAAAGGGGKGMRRVENREGLRQALTAAASEARAAFGDAAVYLERCLERPRHVEVQVLADGEGRVEALGERECSVQRRHQKMIEEAPSVAVDAALRSRLGEAAVRAARAVDYRGAGTVEFLLEPNGAFYFLEMNTRIQVEHPVTEMVYGVDLVREQLRIADDQPMSLPAHPQARGHALECRITSEDPFNSFLPSTGRIEYLKVPAGPGVRWDAGIEAGSDVGLHYDPLLAKLIVWAGTRPDALRRMARALDELVLVGVATSQPFHRRVMAERRFGDGQYDIRYLDDVGGALLQAGLADPDRELVVIAAALAEDERRRAPAGRAPPAGEQSTPWARSARIAALRWPRSR